MHKIKIVFLIALTSFLLISFFSCDSEKEEKTVFRCLGSWDMPPMYHGNPYAPGGVGDDAKNFIFGMLFGYDVFKCEFWPYVGLDYQETVKAVTVKLRRGLLWDDGTPFTSKDVYTSFVLHGGLGEWSEIWRYIDQIEVPDSFTVVFHYGSTKSILSKFFMFTNLIDASYHIYGKCLDDAETLLKMRKQLWQKEEELGKAARKSEDYQKLNTQVLETGKIFRESLQNFKPKLPMGYGPFKLLKVTSDQMLLEKNDNHWAVKEILFDEIRIGRYTTNELVWASLIAGEIDLEKPATPIDVVNAIVKAQPKIKHIPISDFSGFSLVLNNEKFPFSEKDFRQALAYIIDRDKVRMVAHYFGNIVKYSCGILPSVLNIWTSPEFRNTMKLYPVDHIKAEELLKGIGLSRNDAGFWTTNNGKELKFEITSNPNTDWVLAAEEMSRQLTVFGLKTNVRIIEGTLYGPTLGAREYEMAIEVAISAKLHPVQAYLNFYKTNGRIGNITGFDFNVMDVEGNNINLEKLQEALFVTTDPAEQRKIIEKLAWATNEYLPVISLVEKNSQFFVYDGGRVSGWPYGEELQNKFGFNWRVASLKWMAEGILTPGKERVK